MVTDLKDLAQALNEIAPTKYSHFRDNPKVDFITYEDIGTNQTYADNVVIANNTVVSIELHTKEKNLELEEQIRDYIASKELANDENATVYDQTLDLFIKEFIIELND